MFFVLNIAKILKSRGLGLEKSELPWEQNFIEVGVFAVELLACQVSLACVKNWLR